MNPQFLIPLEKVLPQSLAEICGKTDNLECLESTRDLVQAHLFSKYSQRKELAMREIKRYWGRNNRIACLEEGGIIYAYIYFKEPDAYILVGKYSKEDPVFEEVPTDEEREEWKRVLGKKS